MHFSCFFASKNSPFFTVFSSKFLQYVFNTPITFVGIFANTFIKFFTCFFTSAMPNPFQKEIETSRNGQRVDERKPYLLSIISFAKFVFKVTCLHYFLGYSLDYFLTIPWLLFDFTATIFLIKKELFFSTLLFYVVANTPHLLLLKLSTFLIFWK